MENKKTIIGIIIVIILIVALVITSYLYNRFNQTQLNLLTEEANIIIETDILKDGIHTEIKTEKNYANVEKAVKEYMAKLENIYTNMEDLINQINPNDIFSASNIVEGSFDTIDTILADYKEKGEELEDEYQELIKEENINKFMEDKHISPRKEYYVNLYKTIMLGEGMKAKYKTIQDSITEKKYELTYKIDKLEKIKEFLEKNKRYWSVKNDKIQFSNINKMTEYYNLLNQIQE